jgi:hypothetical protein
LFVICIAPYTIIVSPFMYLPNLCSPSKGGGEVHLRDRKILATEGQANWGFESKISEEKYEYRTEFVL